MKRYNESLLDGRKFFTALLKGRGTESCSGVFSEHKTDRRRTQRARQNGFTLVERVSR